MKRLYIICFFALALVHTIQASVEIPAMIIASATKDTSQNIRPPASHNRPQEHHKN